MNSWQTFVKEFLGEEFFQDVFSVAQIREPKADVYEGKNEVIVVIDLPGIENIHTIQLKVQEDQLTIKGYIPSPYQGYKAIHMERKQGDFERTIPLGTKVASNYSSARYRKGVLELRYPKEQKR